MALNDDAARQDPRRPEQWSVPVHGRDEEVHLPAVTASTPDGYVWVAIDGETFVFPPPEPGMRRTRPERHTDSDMVAPMPATVTHVFVTVGDRLEAGQTVLVLEAMKMELPVRAPRDGEVAAVHCAAGDLVQPGRPLVELVEEMDEPR